MTRRLFDAIIDRIPSRPAFMLGYCALWGGFSLVTRQWWQAVGIFLVLWYWKMAMDTRRTYEQEIKVARELLASLHMITFTSRGLPIGTELCIDGDCTSCTQPVTVDSYGVRCVAGHTIHYLCLTQDNDRMRCPLCLHKKKRSIRGTEAV